MIVNYFYLKIYVFISLSDAKCKFTVFYKTKPFKLGKT